MTYSSNEPLATILQPGDVRPAWDSGGSNHVIGKTLWFLESVLDDKAQVVPLVEHLAVDLWIQLLETSHLAVFLRYQLLVHRRDLDEQVVVGQVEVGSEVLAGVPVIIKGDRKRPRLVLPGNTIEIEKKGELALTVVSELGFVSRGLLVDQGAPALTTPASSSSSGKS